MLTPGNLFGLVMRREELVHLVTTGMIEFRGKLQQEKTERKVLD